MVNEELDELRAETVRALEVQRKRLVRRRDAIGGDLARVAEAEEAARLAALAVPMVATTRRGATRIAVVDYATGEAVERFVTLDASRSAREGLERFFQRAKRLRKGAPIGAARLRDAEQAIMAIDDALAAVTAAVDEDAILATRALAKLRPPRDSKDARIKPAQVRKPPFRTFRTSHGDVLVGRGASRNDELTFRVAKPYHLWLHVRGVPGAHVVVPLHRGQVCGSDLLVDAAHLAAHFSDARGELVVEVSYVARKFVRKPRGSPPGAVTMEREKVLALRFDSARAEHLVATEIDQNE
jgi:predicted ribosome quality control (RQC) complex YloA/Tae2 family protein